MAARTKSKVTPKYKTSRLMAGCSGGSLASVRGVQERLEASAAGTTRPHNQVRLSRQLNSVSVCLPPPRYNQNVDCRFSCLADAPPKLCAAKHRSNLPLELFTADGRGLVQYPLCRIGQFFWRDKVNVSGRGRVIVGDAKAPPRRRVPRRLPITIAVTSRPLIPGQSLPAILNLGPDPTPEPFQSPAVRYRPARLVHVDRPLQLNHFTKKRTYLRPNARKVEVFAVTNDRGGHDPVWQGPGREFKLGGAVGQALTQSLLR